MKNKRAFHFSLVSVLFVSFLLLGVTGASAAPPNVQFLYSTNNAETVILTGNPPAQVGVFLSTVGMVLDITSQNGNLYWGTLIVTIPTSPVTTVVTGSITGFITGGGKMTITVVDQDTGAGIGTMSATKDGKKLKNGVLQIFDGSVTSFELKR